MNEFQWEKHLKIRTFGREGSQSDEFRYAYEPTSYAVLERIAASGYITKDNTVIDFGCGKGRVGFFLNHEIGCRVIGLEYDRMIYEMALKNHRSAGSPANVEFINISAEEYRVPPEADRLFFFNPFSVEILSSVMARIKEAWYLYGKEMFLISYYPSDEYIFYLMTVDELIFVDEIDCSDLLPQKNDRERVVIFKTAGGSWQ